MGSLFGSGGGAYKGLKRQAAFQEQEGQDLLKKAESGQLPPGIQSWLDEYLKQAEAKVSGTYSNLGIAGSTAEALDKAGVSAEGAKLKQGYLEQQIQEALALMGLSGTNYSNALAGMAAMNQATATAFSGLGSAIGGTDFSSFGGG